MKQKRTTLIDITNQRFGKLIVLRDYDADKRGEHRWLCKCDCGNQIIALSSHLRNGRIRSCGCLRLDRRNSIIGNNNISLETYKRLYHIYRAMIGRCYKPKNASYKNYGKRGIIICNEWTNNENGLESFCNWAINNGYQENLTLDRIDNNGNYEPNNCRWITIKKQENNRRNNIVLEYKGEKATLKQWAEKLNIKYNTLFARYERYKTVIIEKPHYKDKVLKRIFSTGDLRRESNEIN